MKYLNKEILKKNIESRVYDDMENGRVDGVSVIVCQNKERVYENTFGSIVPGSGKNDLTLDNIYRLASMTKPISGVAAMIAIEKGYFSPDDDVCKYLDGFKNLDVAHVENGEIVIDEKANRNVKIRDCLTHSSGIGTGEVGDKIFATVPFYNGITLSEVVDFYSDKPLAFHPGTSQFYSPLVGIDIVARIIEVKSGMSYGEFLKAEIFDKLDMNDTTFKPTCEQWDRMVKMHDLKDGKAVTIPTVDGCVFNGLPISYESASAGLASTPNDYMKFANMLIDGTYNGKTIVKKELLAEMTRPQLPHEVMPFHEIWGYTVRVIVSEEYKRLNVGTFGWSGAFGTHFFVDPENKIAAVYMKNSAYDGGAGATTANNFEFDVTSAME